MQQKSSMASSPVRGLPSNFSIDKSRPVVPQVYDVISRAILSNALRPGQPLSEKDLAETLHVSRTPAREALIRLANAGLVDIFPRHGTFVSAVSVEEIFEAHTIREALELRIVQLAAQRATDQDKHELERNLAGQKAALAAGDLKKFHRLDEEFHALLSRIAGLTRAWRLINDVKLQLDRVRMIANEDGRQPHEAAADHAAILAAVERNDQAKATKAMQKHLNGSLAAIKRIIRSEQNYFTATNA
jgi:DNA-binding GntR family transcriptional regulator